LEVSLEVRKPRVQGGYAVKLKNTELILTRSWV